MKLSELALTDLLRLYDENRGFALRVYADAQSYAIDSAADYLHDCPGRSAVDWNLGYPGTFVSFSDDAYQQRDEIIPWLESLQRMYCIFDDLHAGRLIQWTEEAQNYIEAEAGSLDEEKACRRCQFLSRSLADYLTRYLNEEISYYDSDTACKSWLSEYRYLYDDMQLIDGEVYELRRIS